MPAAIRAFTLAAFLSLVLTAPAYGALATPTPTAPASGLSVDALPAFSWAGVAGADRYEFQIAADSGMNSPVLGKGDDQSTTSPADAARSRRTGRRRPGPRRVCW